MSLDVPFLIFLGSAFAFSIILAVCILMIATSSQFPVITRSKKEKYFINPITGDAIPWPSINEKSSIHLSIIIPAYNEETRLPVMLQECIKFLETRSKNSNYKYEIIVVSDGSKDRTVEVASEYCTKMGIDKFRILDLETNRGKGGAVRLGMQSARGAMLLFADADGATTFTDLEKLESSLKQILHKDYFLNPQDIEEELAICIGSRAHLQQEAVAKRSFFRNILMWGFHLFTWVFAVKNIKDTQCGFKLLTRRAARICFDSLHVERWAFDAELLYIANSLQIPISEIAVNWTEIEGSKIVPVWSWLQMAKDLFMIWLRYFIGAWKIKEFAMHKNN